MAERIRELSLGTVMFFLGLWLLPPCSTSADPGPKVISDGDFVAYSLRESENLAKLKVPSAEGFLNLGGMTRIVGMVHDKVNQDVIIVGKKVPGLPPGSLDDLVVALRSRLVASVWPMVSIDPNEGTAKTGLQTVRFRPADIEYSFFGKRIYQCDVTLKQYSLGLLSTIEGIMSYKDLCHRYISAELASSGRKIEHEFWQPYADSEPTLQKSKNRPIKDEKNLQCRFWFYPLDTSEVIEVEDVLVIPELHLGVKKEVTGTEPKDLYKSEPSQDRAADDFSSQFTENLSAAESRYEVLKSMRLLYSMVAVAEGIGRLMNRPALDYFSYDYEIKPVEPPKDYKLIEILGVYHLAGGADYLMRISGGVELKAIIRKLNGGDVSGLRDAVLKSRPTPDALYWRLPLRGWQLTREDQQRVESDKGSIPSQGRSEVTESNRIGFSLSRQSYLLEPDTVATRDAWKLFMGFPPPPPPPPSFIVSPTIQYVPKWAPAGVDMAAKPTSAGQIGGDFKRKVLDSRPSDEDLSWSVGTSKRLDDKQ